MKNIAPSGELPKWVDEESPLDRQEGGSHYDLPIQPIEYIHKNNMGYIEGNIIKYATRHRDKNGAEDIKKIIHYCELLLELEYGETSKEEGLREPEQPEYREGSYATKPQFFSPCYNKSDN
jgi:hypothetical protein